MGFKNRNSRRRGGLGHGIYNTTTNQNPKYTPFPPPPLQLIEDFLLGQKRPNPLTHPHQQHPYHTLPAHARGLIAVVALRPGSNDEAAAASSSSGAGASSSGGSGGQGNALVGSRGERRWKVPEAAPFDVRRYG